MANFVYKTRTTPHGLRSFVECDTCQRSQYCSSPEVPYGLGLKNLASIGWCQTETGWLCPFHSDKGTAALFGVFDKTKPVKDG